MTVLDFFLLLIVLAGLIYLFVFGYQKQKAWKQNRPSPYVEGLNALIRGDKQKALNKFKEAARLDTDNIDAYLKIGDVLREIGYYEQAVNIHRDLTVRSGLKVFQKIDILYSLALDYQGEGQYDKAIETVNEMIALDKKDVRTFELKLELTELIQAWDEAYQTLLKLQHLTQSEKDIERLSSYKVNEGLACVKKNAEREGRIRFKEAIKVNPACASAYLYLGDSYIREHRENDALQVWKKFIQTNSVQGHLAFERLEKFLFEQGAFGEIEEIYRNTLEADPKNEYATVSLAQLNQKKGEIGNAIELLETFIKENSNSIIARRELVQLHKADSNYEQMAEHALQLADLCINQNGVDNQ